MLRFSAVRLAAREGGDVERRGALEGYDWRGWRCSKGLRWFWGNAAVHTHQLKRVGIISFVQGIFRAFLTAISLLHRLQPWCGQVDLRIYILAVGISRLSGFLQKSIISGRSADHPRSQCGHVWRGLWEIHVVVGDILIFLGLSKDEVWRSLRREILYTFSCCVACFHECKRMYNIMNYISLLVCHQQILV